MTMHHHVSDTQHFEETVLSPLRVERFVKKFRDCLLSDVVPHARGRKFSTVML
jgi:hypothetical protein